MFHFHLRPSFICDSGSYPSDDREEMNVNYYLVIYTIDQVRDPALQISDYDLTLSLTGRQFFSFVR